MIEKSKGGRGNKSTERNQAICDARKDGKTFPEMGKMFELSRQRLVKIINAGKARDAEVVE
jgi:Mor family transcriptional regulator